MQKVTGNPYMRPQRGLIMAADPDYLDEAEEFLSLLRKASNQQNFTEEDTRIISVLVHRIQVLEAEVDHLKDFLCI